jgi:hypothetical protein
MLVWLMSSQSCLTVLAVTPDVQTSMLEYAYLMESRSWWAYQLWFMAYHAAHTAHTEWRRNDMRPQFAGGSGWPLVGLDGRAYPLTSQEDEIRQRQGRCDGPAWRRGASGVAVAVG